MDSSIIATFNIDRDSLLSILGNIPIPTGSDRARYFRLLDLVYDSDGSLQLDEDINIYYSSIITPPAQ